MDRRRALLPRMRRPHSCRPPPGHPRRRPVQDMPGGAGTERRRLTPPSTRSPRRPNPDCGGFGIFIRLSCCVVSEYPCPPEARAGIDKAIRASSGACGRNISRSRGNGSRQSIFALKMLPESSEVKLRRGPGFTFSRPPSRSPPAAGTRLWPRCPYPAPQWVCRDRRPPPWPGPAESLPERSVHPVLPVLRRRPS